MGGLKDLTGQRFGRLTVIKQEGRTKKYIEFKENKLKGDDKQ